MTLARAIAAALPLTRGERTLLCSGVEGEGRRVALELELQVMEDGDLVGTMGQTVLLESLEADDVEELLARASDRLEALSPDAWVRTPAQLLAPPFRPLPAAAIATADAHAIHDRLQLQAHAAGHESRFDRLDVWPIEARTIYFLVVDPVVVDLQEQLGAAGGAHQREALPQEASEAIAARLLERSLREERPEPVGPEPTLGDDEEVDRAGLDRPHVEAIEARLVPCRVGLQLEPVVDLSLIHI